jgi:6-phosphogluconolactonase (cycloisomerase 2 family)
MKRLAFLVILACAGLFAAAALGKGGRASSAGVSFAACLTGDTRTAAQGSCTAIPTAQPYGDASGLSTPDAIAFTPDGRAAYVASHQDSALAVFDRDPGTGALTFKSCFTGNSFVDACTQLPGAGSNSTTAPVSSPTALALSPDGRSIYVTSGDFHSAQVAHFERDPATGATSYVGCITGDLAATPAGSGVCTPIPSATDAPNHAAGGFGSALGGASGVAISADGRFAYVTAADDDAVTMLVRNPADGSLSFGNCISDNPGLSACSHLPVQRYAALREARAPLLSRDGRNLYVPAPESGAITSFSVGSVTGTLTGAGCISAAGRRRGCKHPEGPNGSVALAAPVRLIESPDGRFVYSASKYGAVATLRRGPGGPLHLQSCITGASQKPHLCKLLRNAHKFAYNSGLAGLVDLGFGDPKGRKLYAISRTDAAVDLFSRNPHTGKVAFRGCSTASTKVGPRGSGACSLLSDATKGAIGSGLYKPSALALAGSWTYVAGARDAAITRLHR